MNLIAFAAFAALCGEPSCVTVPLEHHLPPQMRYVTTESWMGWVIVNEGRISVCECKGA